jgi:hypothetical protein
MVGDQQSLGLAMMSLNESLETVAATCAAYRRKLINEHEFSEQAAEAMSCHLHMKLVELMVK